MPHWDSRKEGNWGKFPFNQPYAKGLKRLKEDVMGKTDFDPAVLFQWGTMQAMAVIQILKDCEKEFGEKGQQLVSNSLRRIGYDMVKQTYTGLPKPEGFSEAEIVSFFATVVNTIYYASLETFSVKYSRIGLQSPMIDTLDLTNLSIDAGSMSM